MIDEIHGKYIALLKSVTKIEPEDMGAVRLALRLALEEQEEEAGQRLAEAQFIIAGLSAEQRTCEPAKAPALPKKEIAPAPAPSPAPAGTPNKPRPQTLNPGFRFQGTDGELREQTKMALRALAARFGRTPSRPEWNRACREFGLVTTDAITRRLNVSWYELCQEAGLQPNVPAGLTVKEDKAENAESPFRAN